MVTIFPTHDICQIATKTTRTDTLFLRNETNCNEPSRIAPTIDLPVANRRRCSHDDFSGTGISMTLKKVRKYNDRHSLAWPITNQAKSHITNREPVRGPDHMKTTRATLMT